jgi:hypothetical protein
MNSERVGRLLLTSAGTVGLIGMALADSRAQYGRYLGLSVCLIMLALAVLLLAPRPAVRTGERARPVRRSTAAAARSRGVPRQREAAGAHPAARTHPAAGTRPAGDVVVPGKSTRAA